MTTSAIGSEKITAPKFEILAGCKDVDTGSKKVKHFLKNTAAKVLFLAVFLGPFAALYP